MIKTFAAVAMLLATSTLYAATPSSGTLAAANATVTWSGGPYTGTTVDNSPVNTSLCTTLTCDSFTLSVNIPANFYTTYPNDEVQIGINLGLQPERVRPVYQRLRREYRGLFSTVVCNLGKH
jgi:hypothetical protein